MLGGGSISAQESFKACQIEVPKKFLSFVDKISEVCKDNIQSISPWICHD
jgi:hypothetical protein